MGTFSVRKTTEQFIAEAKAVHGDKYDYSKVEYVNNKTKVCIICPTHGEFWQIPQDHIKGRGCSLCARKRLFGICDVHHPHDYISYSYWQGMINRCYQQKDYPKNRSYKDCIICNDWFTYSNFKRWFEDTENGFRDGYNIDKDIIKKNNTIYSPETCCFLPPELNKVFTKRKSKRNGLPVGVSFLKSGNFQVRITKSCREIHIGTFNNISEAFTAYKLAKEQYIKELAESYFQQGKITERVYNALMKYEVEITD